MTKKLKLIISNALKNQLIMIIVFGIQLAEITRRQKIITLSTSPYKCNSHTLLLHAVMHMTVDTDDESPGCLVGLPQQGR